MHAPLTITEVPLVGTLVYGALQVHTATLAGDTVNFCRPPRSRVLCFSHDLVLGETRRAILQHWHDAVFASSLDEVIHLISASPFDVIVLCHTVPFDERQSCLALAGRAWPIAKVILVASESVPPQPGVDQVVLGLAGPKQLLRAVQQVLQPAVSFANMH